MTQLTNTYPNAAAHSLVDILNEPDAWGLKWQAQNGLPGVGDLYLAAMDAIYPVNPGPPPPPRTYQSSFFPNACNAPLLIRGAFSTVLPKHPPPFLPR